MGLDVIAEFALGKPLLVARLLDCSHQLLTVLGALWGFHLLTQPINLFEWRKPLVGSAFDALRNQRIHGSLCLAPLTIS